MRTKKLGCSIRNRTSAGIGVGIGVGMGVGAGTVYNKFGTDNFAPSIRGDGIKVRGSRCGAGEVLLEGGAMGTDMTETKERGDTIAPTVFDGTDKDDEEEAAIGLGGITMGMEGIFTGISFCVLGGCGSCCGTGTGVSD